MTKRLTESQIVGILKEAEAGIPVPEVCRAHGVGQSTFYKWRSRYGGMEASLFSAWYTRLTSTMNVLWC